jgi:hypothetical protein
MAMETVVNFVKGGGLQDFGIRVPQSSDRARLVAVIPVGTGSIVGALVMILECGHVIETVNDIWTHPEASSSGGVVVTIVTTPAESGEIFILRSHDIHLEFFCSSSRELVLRL